jgi:hypothetical protein
MTEPPASPTAPGKSCGGCTLCCKVLSIKELAKPQGAWCPKCSVGRGCSIYAQRPEECRAFTCGYLQLDYLGPVWWPASIKAKPAPCLIRENPQDLLLILFPYRLENPSNR